VSQSDLGRFKILVACWQPGQKKAFAGQATRSHPIRNHPNVGCSPSGQFEGIRQAMPEREAAPARARDANASFERRYQPGRTKEGATDHISAALLGLLDHASFGVLILTPTLRVEFMNSTAARILRHCSSLSVQRGFLVATSAPAAALLAERARSPGPAFETVSAYDERTSSVRHQLLVTRLYLRRCNDPCVLLLHEPHSRVSISRTSLKKTYGLTASELDVVERLVRGLSLRECAADLGISIHTVRTHMKKIFSKCNVRTQAALVRQLLAGPAGTLAGG
jgi:DNA-binding CsgD family transcriptional regulator